jgi:protein-tyrosine-phosphatase
MIDIMEPWKKKVAFICVHNSCRSQVAEALGRLLAIERKVAGMKERMRGG